jgi:transposase
MNKKDKVNDPELESSIPQLPQRDSPQWREGRRLRAWELRKQDWTQTRIAQALGVSQGAVSQWLKRAQETGGPQALLHRPAPGVPAKLGAQQRKELTEQLLPQWLKEGATFHGFVGEVWTRERIAHLIEARFGVRYHPSNVGRILRKAGFTLQKPMRVAHQRSEEAVQKWAQEEWPALKKSGQ